MNIKMLSVILFALPIGAANAGSTAPPPSWNPQYEARILILQDKSAVIRMDLDEYASAKVISLNNTLKKSHAEVKFKLAGTESLNYKIPSLDALYQDQKVSQLKAKYNADFVYAFGDYDLTWDQCGKAYVTSSNTVSFGIGRAAAWICPSATSTFIHEVGHNLGLDHNYSDNQSAASGHGIWAWVTVMGYPGVHGGLIVKDRYSNPDIKCDSFYKCGDTNKADAVGYINANAKHRFKELY